MTLQARRLPALEPLPPLLYEPLVRAALAEDFGLGGDLTSEATVAAGTTAIARLVARRPGVLAGLDPALLAFRLLDPAVRVDVRAKDGDELARNGTIALLEGDARALLGAERTALNLLSHTSGIATATAAYRPSGRGNALLDLRNAQDATRLARPREVRRARGRRGESPLPARRRGADQG